MISIYSQHIGRGFGIEKCALFKMKSGKRGKTEGIELSNQESIETFGKNENYQFLETLEEDISRDEEKNEEKL